MILEAVEEGAAAGEGGYFLVQAGEAVVDDLAGFVAVLQARVGGAGDEVVDDRGGEACFEEFSDAGYAGGGGGAVGAVALRIALWDKEALLFVVAEQAGAYARGSRQFPDQHCDPLHIGLTFTPM